MKILVVKTNETVKAVQILAKKDNEITFADLRKLVSSNSEMLYTPRISRLAYLYVMFVDKDSKVPQFNKLATLLTGDSSRPVMGDAVLIRTNHLGSGAKMFALENDEAAGLVERMSKLLGKKLEMTT